MDNIQKIKGFNVMEFMVAIAFGFGIMALLIYAFQLYGVANSVEVVSPEFNATYNQFNGVSEATSAMYQNISTGDAFELSSLTSVFAFTKAATRVLGIFFSMPIMLTRFLSNGLVQLGFDPTGASIIMGIIMTVVTIIIVFAIISFLTRSKV